ncbi:protein PUTATIVE RECOMBINATION INITIATION DEFECT 1 isoform X2 [Magnolia sinica]|uniref:protein PUTATIVE RECOMBINATION INITIATION DEFECT 1 isoform X2 n=1 Tax=Magnolia sinica TaxID=86752 RepID=UPI00265B1EB0|nr:protein PUTATIVE RECOMBINATION INITIATION DEFECT 1 isoform X2 [Magnolia sinica]
MRTYSSLLSPTRLSPSATNLWLGRPSISSPISVPALIMPLLSPAISSLGSPIFCPRARWRGAVARSTREEIHGEILFVLYKLSILQGEGSDDFLCFCPKLLYLSLEALIKTQHDDVRMNCIALLTVLAQRGYLEFEKSLANVQSSCNSREAGNFIQTTQLATGTSLISLFADAIKGPLLSSDTQVQISALDLIFHLLSLEVTSVKQIQILVEESITDYVFEVLRLSGNKDPLVVSCLRVLGLLATAEEAIRQSLAIGFPTLIPVLRYVSEIPLHPVQPHTLKLISTCIFHCPGIISRSQIEELVVVLTAMFRMYTRGEMGMLSETFTMACSTFIGLLTLPSSCGIPSLAASVQEAFSNAIQSSFCGPRRNPNQVLLYSLYLLKEAYAYSQEQNTVNTDRVELANCTIQMCETHILPWLGRSIDEAEEDEEIVLGILETFHLILLQGSDIQAKKFAEMLASSSWFSLSFGCLGLFLSDQMKWRVYLLLGSIVDKILGNDSGQPIREAATILPSDPLDLLFLLGQKSSHCSDLISCQSAVLLMLYTSSLQDESLADDRQVLASLEQYILVNNANVADSTSLTRLVHLYGLIRGADTSYQTPYSLEAENLLFHLLVEKDWDLLSARIHPRALKWLFQQDRIRAPLSAQILNFCRFNSEKETQISNHGNNTQMTDIEVIAELVAASDNIGASLLVSLLKQLQEEGREDYITSLMNLMAEILNIFPAASNQFCQNGISDVIRSLYYSTYSSARIFTTCSILVFNILQSAYPQMLLDHKPWHLVTTKLLECLIPTFSADTCNQEGHLVICILSLILHHSTNQALTEAAKVILLNTSLASAVNNIIQAACGKGLTLVDHDEETSTGETLTFVLLLYFFSLRSLDVLLQGTLDWQDFLHSSNSIQPLSVVRIPCHDLCRLIHFGPASIKLVASHCLLELLIRITDQRNSKQDGLKCSGKYLQSVIAVLEGLVFYGDIRVAMNCALCLSTILRWEKLGVQEKRAVGEDKWCRVVMEELALSLAAPSLASKSFMNQHKPATHIAIALLRLDRAGEWMRSVFNGPCISGIIGNLSAGNMSAEMARLFRELLVSGYLNEEQIEALNQVFQACRKQVYMSSTQEQDKDECFEKVLAVPDDLGKACRVLIHLMSFSTHTVSGVRAEQRKLLEEIEMFSREYSTRT